MGMAHGYVTEWQSKRRLRMLTTYDRIMREWRIKRLEARLQRERELLAADGEVIPGYRVVQVIRQAHKDTMRNMEGQ